MIGKKWLKQFRVVMEECQTDSDQPSSDHASRTAPVGQLMSYPHPTQAVVMKEKIVGHESSNKEAANRQKGVSTIEVIGELTGTNCGENKDINVEEDCLMVIDSKRRRTEMGSVVGNDVINFVNSFFESGHFPTGINATNLVLIPKKKQPLDMGDFRPIALCNVLYKIISKVLANRLKHVLPTIISETQSAFLQGRLISDNIMISYEIMHFLKRKRRGREGFMALKLDMSKAYDRLEWGYIRAMLVRMGFDGRWINLVMYCVSSVSFSIVHGGHEIGPIGASRGIRQGDPLSPYLFILCAEEEEAFNVKELLHTFEMAYGQKINFTKSSVFYSNNTVAGLRDTICDLLGIFEADENGTYLGLPYAIGRNKNSILGFLKDKLRKRINGWEGRMLSRAGKEVLLKSVAQALPNYAMCVFLLPVDTCKELEGLMAKFWWNTGKSQSRGTSWMSWKRMCRHKHAGGLGFRDLRDFNIALLGKQAWRLLTHDLSLVGRVFKARYYPAANFLKSDLGDNPSFVWRSVFEAKELLISGVSRSIGAGTTVSIMNDPWLPDINPFVISNHPALMHQSVSSLMRIYSRSWDDDIIQDLFEERDQALIYSIQLSDTTVEDQWYWKYENHGGYTVNSAYKHMQVLKGAWPTDQSITIWRTLWNIKVPPKMGINLSNGRLIEAYTLGKMGRVDPEMAEIIGIKEALSWIDKHHWQNVVLESDSLLCVQAIKSNIPMLSQFGLLVIDVRQLLLSLNFVEICFVKRSANKAAHCLARSSCFSSGRALQFENCSSEVRSVVLNDCHS
uniref:Reverse transcriptase domain-containing protein n=1 Tax=Cannabis sativa TaxID=3483 RepID=A0A803NKE8_CANSA